MKTAFNNGNKDNIAISVLLVASLFALATGVVTSNPAVANQAVAVQKMDTIVVTASPAPAVTFDTMVVSASRKIGRA